MDDLIKRIFEEVLELAEPDCPYCEAITAVIGDALDAIEQAEYVEEQS